MASMRRGLGFGILVGLLVGVTSYGLLRRDAEDPPSSPGGEGRAPASEPAGPTLLGRTDAIPDAATPADPAPGPGSTTGPAVLGWRIHGTCLGPDGRPAGGALVLATLGFGPSREPLGSAVSAADGTWVLPVDRVRDVGPLTLPHVTCELLAWKSGVGRVTAGWSTWPTADTPSLAGTISLRLVAGRPVAGRVRTETGEPVPGATVLLCPRDGGREAVRGTTGPTGTYVVDWPTGFRGDLVAFEARLGVGRRPETDLADGDRMPDITLSLGPSVEGHVRFADGTPVDGVWVWGEPTGSETTLDPCLGTSWVQGMARTAADGGFRLPLPREGSCHLWINGSEAEADARTGDRGVVLVVPERRIRVRVRDADGRPLAAAALFVIGWGPANAGRLDDLLEGRASFREAHLSADWSLATSGMADGIDDLFLPAGGVAVAQAHLEGTTPAEAVLHAPDPAPHADLDLVLGHASARGGLRVTCMDTRGVVVPHARVEVTTRLGAHLAVATVPAGHRFPELPSGPVTVRAEARGGPAEARSLPPRDSFLLPATAQAEVGAGDTTDLTLRLGDGGRLRVLLRQVDAPAPALEDDSSFDGPGVRAVEVASGRVEHFLLYVGEPGTPSEGHASSSAVLNRPLLTTEVLPPGEYRIEVAARGEGWARPLATAAATITPRRVTDVVLDLPAGR